MTKTTLTADDKCEIKRHIDQLRTFIELSFSFHNVNKIYISGNWSLSLPVCYSVAKVIFSVVCLSVHWGVPDPCHYPSSENYPWIRPHSAGLHPLGIPDMRYTPLIPCYWHLVVITGGLFKRVHLRPYPYLYWHLVVTTETRKVGKRAVLILLECFLVLNTFTWSLISLFWPVIKNYFVVKIQKLWNKSQTIGCLVTLTIYRNHRINSQWLLPFEWNHRYPLTFPVLWSPWFHDIYGKYEISLP